MVCPTAPGLAVVGVGGEAPCQRSPVGSLGGLVTLELKVCVSLAAANRCRSSVRRIGEPAPDRTLAGRDECRHPGADGPAVAGEASCLVRSDPKIAAPTTQKVAEGVGGRAAGSRARSEQAEHTEDVPTASRGQCDAPTVEAAPAPRRHWMVRSAPNPASDVIVASMSGAPVPVVGRYRFAAEAVVPCRAAGGRAWRHIPRIRRSRSASDGLYSGSGASSVSASSQKRRMRLLIMIWTWMPGL